MEKGEDFGACEGARKVGLAGGFYGGVEAGDVGEEEGEVGGGDEVGGEGVR